MGKLQQCINDIKIKPSNYFHLKNGRTELTIETGLRYENKLIITRRDRSYPQKKLYS